MNKISNEFAFVRPSGEFIICSGRDEAWLWETGIGSSSIEAIEKAKKEGCGIQKVQVDFGVGIR